ncbi:MAG: DUF4294 domain-containing protein [Bacteroidetes bacterium]|nr:DUF4294 domain-containing protein [Bacteroidota bacterium]
MNRAFTYRSLRFSSLIVALIATLNLFAQNSSDTATPKYPDTPPTIEERAKNWGANDTMIVSAIMYEGQLLPYKEMEMAWVSNMSQRKFERYKQEWNRLRNAVYVTYPFARTAGYLLNEMNAHIASMTSKGQRKDYIKTKEKELKAQFADPLSNLSVYQGKVLMKLINRQTGNNCYDIVKEYRGGITARFYQTVAFFFGSSLKQDWDISDKTDRQIENFVKEIDGMWYNNPNRR